MSDIVKLGFVGGSWITGIICILCFFLIKELTEMLMFIEIRFRQLYYEYQSGVQFESNIQ